MAVSEFARGGFRYVEGAFQYSAGVAALPGYRILRVRFQTPVPIDDGWSRISGILADAGRPTAALCACELRSPAPFSEEGFVAFNRSYVEPLKDWGLLDGVRNAVARSNVCPAINPPPVPSFYGFCYTVPDADAKPSFVTSGTGEAAEGGSTYKIVRLNDTTPEGLREKARFVLRATEARMAELGFGWADTTGTHVYTIHDFHPFIADELVRRGAAHSGLNWQFSRPPVAGMEFEMDCRGVMYELVIP